MERTRKKVRVRCRHVTRGSRERYSFRRYISPPIPLIHRPPPSLRFPPLGLSPPAHHEEEVHEHVEIEQSYVISGSFADHDGVCRAGEYVWRRAGSRHAAWTDEGCLVLAIFLKPNKFFD